MFARRTDSKLSREYRLLQYATVLYSAGLLAHIADHLRRGIDVLTPQVLWAGNISTLAGLALIVAVFARSRLAPGAAVVFGFGAAFGVAAVHLLPHWSALSDAFPGSHDAGVTAISWVVVLVEIVGSLAMGIAGVAVLRSSSRNDVRPLAKMPSNV
jgi:hypothetical protein